MTGALCHRQKKMMGRGADGGCGTEERPCRPISKASGRSPVTQPKNAEKQFSRDVGVDFFSQARKALCEHSPFDIPEGGSVSGLSVPTLPSVLTSLLKQTNSRKRHKKTHSGADKKSSRQGEKARGRSIWIETEEHFRDLALLDIDALFKITPSNSLATRKKGFMIPYVGNEPRANLNLDAVVDEKVSVSSGENLNVRNENGDVGKDEGKEVVKEEDGQLMEIDSDGPPVQFSVKEEKGCSVSDFSSGLEWLLGSRSRILLTSERPSKKRKLLGENAGLEKILIACPCDGNSSLCHFCCTDDTRKESNRLIVCSSCKVAVHQKCYGVLNDVDSSWLCSWCKQKNDGNDMVKPCVLCPKQGGALMPIHKSDENGGSVENSDQENSIYPIVNPIIADLIRTEEFSNFYIHPCIHKKLLQMQNGMLCKNRVGVFEGSQDTLYEFDGSREGDLSRLVSSSNASICCSHQSEHSKCNEKSCTSDDLEQLVKARKLGALKLSPEDEVEGEIIYYQHILLGNAIARNRFTDNLVSRIAKSLPQEVEAARRQRWDTVLVNQYLYELREAKKQGRKERRHREAQAVLAAASAAAAASSRISSSRKDGLEDSRQQENGLKLNASVGRAGINSQPRAKDALSRNAVPRISSEKYSDIFQTASDFSKEHTRSCDICRRSETLLNPILVCSGCKVAVHLDCYLNVKETSGPWCCELCEELFSSRSSGAPSLNFWEKPYRATECGLCGGTTGAFRKSVDGQWIHAFCAEWVLESTFRRGQVNPVEGMEMVSRGVDICCICHHNHGACIKCSYGHCQTTFHPSCARSAGFYMNMKLGGGKLQHKAYCEKHSVEQRAKAETQKHGIEELKSMKQIRVELERLRLLCERIIKREKLKRELVLCSHEILACKRDHVTRSVLVHSSFLHPDVSSESATTSLKGHTDGYKSCNEAMQSDDVTVDSTISVKHRVKVPVPMDNDQRTDDSSTSQSLFVRKPTERVPFSGKQIPHKYSLASCNGLDNAEWNSKLRKPIETFEKELVMTSDEASKKNSRLPKGYCYVPVDCLPKEKQLTQDACSDGQLEHNG